MVYGNDGPGQAAAEKKSARTQAREAFFIEFAQALRKEFPGVPFMVTGGFSSRGGMEKAVADGDCDLVGLARPALADPAAPNNVFLNPEVKDQDATFPRKKNKVPWFAKVMGMPVVGAGLDNVCDLTTSCLETVTDIGDSSNTLSSFRTWRSREATDRER
jgi:hypothetical protein